jgi:integrase
MELSCMPRLSHRLPSYRLHKSDGRALVTIHGRDIYLGRHGTPESRAEYERVIAEWLAHGKGRTGARPRPAAPAPDELAVVEVVAAFMRHAETHYRDPAGKMTREVDNCRDALKPVVMLYGSTPARSFGPIALRAVRDEMVKAGLARSTVNDRVNRVRRCFKWAASMELIPSSVVQGLATVPGLQRGRTTAREAPPVGPVLVETVEATLPYLPAPVAAMIQVQLATGARPAEICIMRGMDLDRAGVIWQYRPSLHKNAWRGRDRIIAVGPRAQAILRPLLTDDPAAPLFVATRPDGSRGAYSRGSYCQCIARACRRAGLEPWTPHQLRHTAATAIRATHGLEAAQTLLGHARADVTQIYAERDLAKAVEVAREVG